MALTTIRADAIGASHVLPSGFVIALAGGTLMSLAEASFVMEAVGSAAAADADALYADVIAEDVTRGLARRCAVEPTGATTLDDVDGRIAASLLATVAHVCHYAESEQKHAVLEGVVRTAFAVWAVNAVLVLSSSVHARCDFLADQSGLDPSSGLWEQ